MNSKNVSKRKILILDLVMLIVSVALDRIGKIYAYQRLKEHPSVSVIKGILELKYLENTGAAFGLLKGQNAFFILVTLVMFSAILYVILKSPGKSKYIPLNIYISLILGGAVGNVVDRLIYGFVIDFIYFDFINFPIFNIADAFVMLSTILLVLSLLFYYKEVDLYFLMFKEKKLRDINN